MIGRGGFLSTSSVFFGESIHGSQPGFRAKQKKREQDQQIRYSKHHWYF